MTRERCGLSHSCACSFSSLSFLFSASLDCVLVQMFAHCIGSSLCLHFTHMHVSSRRECCSSSLRLLHSLHFFSPHLSDHPASFFCPSTSSRMSWLISLRTFADDLHLGRERASHIEHVRLGLDSPRSREL